MQPTHSPYDPDRPFGWQHRYNLTRADGSPTDAGSQYLILRLDSGGKDPQHIAAGRVAALAYAQEIEAHLPDLAAMIREYVTPLISQDTPALAEGVSGLMGADLFVIIRKGHTYTGGLGYQEGQPMRQATAVAAVDQMNAEDPTAGFYMTPYFPARPDDTRP